MSKAAAVPELSKIRVATRGVQVSATLPLPLSTTLPPSPTRGCRSVQLYPGTSGSLCVSMYTVLLCISYSV
jgi:hypothetical protein